MEINRKSVCCGAPTWETEDDSGRPYDICDKCQFPCTLEPAGVVVTGPSPLEQEDYLTVWEQNKSLRERVKMLESMLDKASFGNDKMNERVKVLEGALENLSERVKMVSSGVAESIELIGLCDAADEALKPKEKL